MKLENSNISEFTKMTPSTQKPKKINVSALLTFVGG